MTLYSQSKGWNKLALRELVTINYGKSPKDILSAEGHYPVVGTAGTKRYGSDFLYDGDSIVLGRKGTIDRVHFATGKFWTIDTAYFLSDFNGSLPRWLFYFLQTIDLRQLNEATGVPSLSRDILYQIEIDTPPKPEQTKIAEVLSTVDRVIEQTEALIAKQQRIKIGLMQDLLTFGTDEHGNLRSEETHEFKDSPLGRIPVEWEVKRVDKLAKVSYGISDAIDVMNRTGIATITLPCVNPNGYLDTSPLKLAFTPQKTVKDRDMLNKGDLLFNWRNGSQHHLGKTAYFDRDGNFTHVGFLLKIRTYPEECDSRFLWFLINDIKSKGYFLNAKIQVNNTFNSSELNAVELAVPTIIGEQQAIRDHLNAIEAVMSESNVRFNKLKSLKTALMQDLLTGEVRVTSLLTEQEVTA